MNYSPILKKTYIKTGRPRLPISQISNDALWKRAQRADNRPPNKGMIRHHLDGSYGRKSPKVVYMSRAAHNRLHKRKRRKVRRRSAV